MKKVLKDTKSLLLENMVKLNPDFQLREEEEKWIQGAVNPEHKGYCTPMTKPTCTPKRKALAKRFKKGIDETYGVPDPLGANKAKAINEIDDYSPEYIQQYKPIIEKLKSFMDELLKTEEFDVIDTLYRLLLDKSHKRANSKPLVVTEDDSFEYQKKVELLKGKIDFLYDNNHYDIIDKINGIISQLLPDEEPEAEITEAMDKDTYFPTLSAALDGVREKVGKMGYTVDEDSLWTQFGTGGIGYGETQRGLIPLMKNGVPARNRSVTVVIYRMDSGTYELTSYIN